MGFRCGIVGLPNVGKSTLFNAVSQAGAEAANFPFCTIDPNVGVVTVPDARLTAIAEVAKAAVELDGVKHMVMTTGTPPTRDRGASILCESSAAVKAAVNLPIQGQCEPPDDAIWFSRMKEAGVDALGMHLEAVTEEVRALVMPGKATVSVEVYLQAFADAVAIFGRGQVSTYILAGLGDSADSILEISERLVKPERPPACRSGDASAPSRPRSPRGYVMARAGSRGWCRWSRDRHDHEDHGHEAHEASTDLNSACLRDLHGHIFVVTASWSWQR